MRRGPATCRMAPSTIRMSSSRSTTRGSSPSSPIARRWEPARGPACRWSWPTSSRPTGRGCAAFKRPATRPNTATRVLKARAASGPCTHQSASAAPMAVCGVEKVVKIDGTPAPAKFAPLGGVAVVARSTWAAMQGREALKVAWDDGPNKIYDSAAYKAQLEATARQPGKIVRNDGDAEKALGAAAKTVSDEDYLPHLA